jgi:GTP-binding protein EngB required for normal cell division
LAQEADEAEAVLERARQREGFTGSTYVLALAGGTGVGKSALLNALAGRTVSAVRAVRPTTEQPTAWVAQDRLDEVASLLDWLGVDQVASHANASLSAVAIVDLPDFDSVRTEHRATVDRLLPKIDALAWVLDLEKYDDARLHAYLRRTAPHAASDGRVRFILNKADRVRADDRPALLADLHERLVAAGYADPTVNVISALSGEGIDALRQDLAEAADAKAVVTAKLASDAARARDRLIHAVGLEPDAPYRPLMDDAIRREALDAAVAGALALMDIPGLAQQIRLAVMSRARWSGGSMLGRVVELLRRLTGQRRRTADPATYLREWRRRGALGRVTNPVRAALVQASASLPAAARGTILSRLNADAIDSSLEQAFDQVARDSAPDMEVGRSPLWVVIGVLHLATAAAFLFAVLWYVTLFVSQGQVPVATADMPILGPVPLPLILLVGSVLVSAVLGWVLSLHAAWRGRRIAARVADRVALAVATAVAHGAFGRLDELEIARRKVVGSPVTQR